MQPRSADSSPAGADLVCRYLPDSTLIYVNEAYCNFFGRSRESLIGRRFIDLIPRSLHSAARAHVEQLCRERNTLMSEHPVVSGSAGVRWQEWVDSVVSAPGSSELVLQGRGRDVTVRHASSTPRGGEKFFRGGVWVLADSGLEPGSTQDLPWVLRQLLGIPGPMAEREINQWLAQVGRLMTLGELAASVIHQISQPLTAITGNVEAAGDRLQAGCMPLDQLSELVDEIRHDALRAGEVIRHARGLLLGPSSAEDVVDANALTMETIQLVRAESDRRGVRIETDLRSVPTLRGNRLELQQVLLNLILNGIEAMAHTPRGQRRLRIRTGRPALNRIRLVIVDHGCGVPPDRLPRLFEPFYTTKERGLGLGLAIARKIVAAHGGRIRVANNTSRPGATFAVDLPSNRDDTSREAARRLK